MKRHGYGTTWRVGLLLVAALTLAAGCATSWTNATLESVPPANGYRLMGVTVLSGETIPFDRPAYVETDEEGASWVVGEVRIADNMTRRTTVSTAEVELYWVQVAGTVDATGVIVGQVAAEVAGAALLEAIFGCCG